MYYSVLLLHNNYNYNTHSQTYYGLLNGSMEIVFQNIQNLVFSVCTIITNYESVVFEISPIFCIIYEIMKPLHYFIT